MALTQHRLEKLVTEVKLVGRMFTSAVLHPTNYPELNSIDELIGQAGLRLAFSINTNGGIKDGQGFLFHESQVERVNYRWHLDETYIRHYVNKTGCRELI